MSHRAAPHDRRPTRAFAMAVACIVAGPLAGCGAADTGSLAVTPAGSPAVSPTDAPPSASPAKTQEPSTSPPPSPRVRRVELSVTGRDVTPPPGQVEVASGETIELVITSDVDNEVHVHGVEIEKALPAGTPVVVQVTGGEPGVYEVELHDPSLLLAQLVVR